MKQTFSNREILKEATAILKPHRLKAIGQYLFISFILAILFSVLFGRGALIGSFITIFLVIRWSLSYVKKGSFSFEEAFEGVTFKHFIYFICTLLLIGLSIVGGLILLIVPGIIFAIRLMFAMYISVEKQIKPMAALKESKRITKGYRWKIFWFCCLMGLINILGFLCLFVGILYTIPLSKISTTLLYKKLSEKAVN
ncbi:MAG: hypothetical protein WCQ32_02225 [bacterium]